MNPDLAENTFFESLKENIAVLLKYFMRKKKEVDL